MTSRSKPRLVKGTVVSDKMNKTRIIEVRRRVRHSFYHKNMMNRTRFYIHDEKNESKVGDLVLAALVRPLSKNKSFKLKTILGRRVDE